MSEMLNREAANQRLARCLIDVEARTPICIHDWSVPAEEEALGIKLAVEHRENFVLGI